MMNSLDTEFCHLETSHISPTWLDDRYEAILLANGRVAGQGIGVLDYGYRRRGSTENIFDVQHGSPLREARPLLVVLSTASIQIVHSLRDTLSHRSSERFNTLIHLLVAITEKEK